IAPLPTVSLILYARVLIGLPTPGLPRRLGAQRGSSGWRTLLLRAPRGRAPTDMSRTPAARRTRPRRSRLDTRRALRGTLPSRASSDGFGDARASVGGASDHGAYLNGWRNASAALAPGT